MERLDEQTADQTEWSSLESEYEPGPFVFDYFNHIQLADVAQSLGLDLAQTREVTRETRQTGRGKFAVKVFEAERGGERGVAHAATHAGAMPTAMLIAILARLDQALRLRTISKPSVEDSVAACRAAASERGWTIIDGDWIVSNDPLSLRLVRPAGASSDLNEHELRVEALIPALPTELTPTGRVRLRSGQRLAANVFGQFHAWNETEPTFTVIAHAEFDRTGDPRFAWRGVSFGMNGGSE